MDAQSIADLEDKHLDGNWLVQPRGKTQIIRTAYVDDETLEAIERARKTSDGPIFRTQRGNTWCSRTSGGSFHHAFKALREKSGIESKAGFHALRRGFAAVANTLPAKDATIRHVMAHSQNMLHDVYVGEPNRQAIKSLCNGVHCWAFDYSDYEAWRDITTKSGDFEEVYLHAGFSEILEAILNKHPCLK